MNGKRVFVDSNILLYLFTDDELRKQFVESLFHQQNTISTQVVNENVNVCLRKIKLPKDIAFAHGTNLLNAFNVVNIFSSTIIAAALQNECDILFSEDLHADLLIEEKLRIVNPFKGLK